MCVECSGYILEELRDAANYEQFEKDVADANIFIGSLIFVQELADKVVEAVEPQRERMDAVVVFPSMPAVMKLNKIGSFTIAAMGQSKSVMGDFMKKNKPKGTGFQDSMLKLVRTLPKVLKYLPGDKAKDARSFMMSLQYWLGGSPENIEALLLNLANNYVPEIADGKLLGELKVVEPEVIPDKGIWHPVAPRVFETTSEYMEWLEKEHAPAMGIDFATAPVVGVLLQKSHINTKDDAHYVSLVMELESKGALVIPTYTGSLDFSQCIDEYFYSLVGGVAKAAVDVLIQTIPAAGIRIPARPPPTSRGSGSVVQRRTRLLMQVAGTQLLAPAPALPAASSPPSPIHVGPFSLGQLDENVPEAAKSDGDVPEAATSQTRCELAPPDCIPCRLLQSCSPAVLLLQSCSPPAYLRRITKAHVPLRARALTPHPY